MLASRKVPTRARISTNEEAKRPSECTQPKPESTNQPLSGTDSVRAKPLEKADSDELPDFDEFRHEMEEQRKRRIWSATLLFACMVLLPAILAATYLIFIATPRFTVEAAFVIRMPEGSGQSALMPGLAGGSAGGATQDAIAIQEWLQSRNAMRLVEEKLGILAHFSNPAIDPIQRISESATSERLYRRFKSRVHTGFDPTEGIVRVSVTTHDPKLSLNISNALMDSAQDRITAITESLTSETVNFAIAQVAASKERLEEAARTLKETQIKNAILSHEDESRLLADDLSSLNARLIEARITRRGMLDNRNPNDARLRSVDSEIETLVEEVEKRRSQISGTNDAGKSTAATKIEVATLESELGIQRELWLEALQVKERVVAEANRQRRMLIVMVTPIESDEPSFPRPIRDMPFVIMGLMALHMLSTISLSMIRDHLSG